MNPVVSVVIPVHNAESTIESAVLSIQRQSLLDIEIILIDDGSTDLTPQIIDKLTCADNRIRAIHAPHRGIIHALNIGIAESRGELIARMDADDISHHQRLEKQAAFMRQRPEISVCSCLVRMFPCKNLLGGLIRYEAWLNSLISPEDIARDMFVESPVAHPSVVMRREELLDIGAYKEHGWPEDYDLWLRYHTAGKRFAKLDSVLFFWRHSAARLTFADSRYSVENFLRAKAHYLARTLKDVDRHIVLWGAGQTGRRLSKHLVREGLVINAVVDVDPNKIGSVMRGIPIVSPEYLAGRKDVFVIAAVSSLGARQLIREQLFAFGFVETRDFICAA